MRRLALFVLVIGLGALGLAFAATRAKEHNPTARDAALSPSAATTTLPLGERPAAPAPGPTSVDPCRASNVSLSASRGSGAGGEKSVVVVVKNVGVVACSIRGYPTAWFVDAAGARLDPVSTAPTANMDPPGPTVRLAPGDIASTNLWTPDPEFGPPANCNPATARAVHISLPADASPGGTTAIETLVCTANYFIRTTPFMAGDVPND